MKNNIEDFDSIFKDKLESQEFPFNEENWKKAAQLIDASRSSKKSAGKYLIGGLVVAGILIITATFYYLNQNITSNELAVNNGSDNTTVKSTVNSNQVNSTNNSNSSSNTSANNTAENNNEHKTSEGMQNEHSSGSELKSENINSSNNSERIENTKQQNTTSDSKNTDKALTANESTNNNGVTLNNSVDQKSTNRNTTTKNKSGNIIKAKNNSANANLKKENNEIKSKGDKNKALISGNVYKSLEANSEVAKSKSAEQTKASDKQTKEQKENKNLANNQENQNMKAKKNTLNQPDTAQNNVKQKDYVKNRKHGLLLELGVDYSLGWNVNNQKNGDGLYPVFGANYRYKFNDKSAIQIGAQYNALSNLTQYDRILVETSYNNGVVNDVTNYKTTVLHYLVMPVKYQYKFNKLNALSAGVNLTYLANSKDVIERYTTLDGNVIESETKNSHGNSLSGFNRFNSQIAIGFHKTIIKNLNFNFEYSYALMNAVKDINYFKQPEGYKNSRLSTFKITFTYNLLPE